MLPPVVLFDLDDTLVSFSAGPRDYWQEAWQLHGGEARGVSAPRWSEVVWEVAGPYWADEALASKRRQDLFAARRDVAAMAFQALGIEDDGLSQRVADEFTTRKEAAVAPFEGAIETLEALRARGVRLGLVTNGSGTFQRRKLERYGLARFFEAILIEGEWGRGKPDPSIFQEALTRLGATPEQTWMVGDNLNADIAGAQALGMRGIWNDHARAGLPAEPPARPHRVIHQVSELL
ncbi:MAG: HAD family hydrolase [Myxococcales bacterium]|nr:HAD family hydrolase [Myxococcales bacterium]